MATKTLSIQKCVPLASGVGKYGEWTKYRVVGTSEDGTALPEEAISWKDFSGQSGEFDVKREESEKYGVSYVIKKAGQSGGWGARIDELEARLLRLEAAVNGASSDVPAPEEPRGGGGFKDVSDIPFGPTF